MKQLAIILQVWRDQVKKSFKNTFLLFSLLFPVSVFAANPAVLFVFDGSGSMWGQVDGKTKIELAKNAMIGLVNDFPAGTDIGLIAYGHRKKGDCNDIETLASLGSSKESVISAVQSINPKGKTPLTKSIQFAAEQLKNRDAPTSIVVVSDGKESCNADPCAAAAAVRKAGVNLKIHVIGFDVKKDEAEQLQCIAKNGGGKYFAANNAGDLAKSFAAVKKEVVQKKPASKVIFRDDFNEDFVKDDWEVMNSNPDATIVEDGMLQILTEVPEKKLFDPKNLFLYKGKLPKQYEVEERVLMTQMESCTNWSKPPFVGLILKQDGDNAIALVAGSISSGCSNYPYDAVTYARVKNGKWQPSFEQGLGHSKENRPVRIKLRREKRKFMAFYYKEDKGGARWVKVGEFTVLRPKYRLGLMAARGSGKSHDTLDKIDWFELRELK